ncbi:hypothetical protein KFE98_18530 [bacterium SCSIO 12741]|nr:hypothetical protein KFE98_18530 [bacterium SCSIO 12741]
MKEILENWKLAAVTSLTLGLAPFVPEPHIVGKLHWIAGGAVGMKPMDWFDTLLHGVPWVWLVVALLLTVIKLVSPNKEQPV